VKTESLVLSIVITNKTYQYHAHSNFKSQRETQRNFDPKTGDSPPRGTPTKYPQSENLRPEQRCRRGRKRGNKMATKRTRRRESERRGNGQFQTKGKGKAGSGVTFLKQINHLVFVTVKCGVLFEVHRILLNSIWTNCSFKGLNVFVLLLGPFRKL
jgi:hypothetical protein